MFYLLAVLLFIWNVEANWPAIDVKPPTKQVWIDAYHKTAPMSQPIIQKCKNDFDWASGPIPQNTEKILQILDKYQAKATFFVVGSRVYEHPLIVKSMVEQGHELGLLTWSNTSLSNHTRDEIIAEYLWTQDILRTTNSYVAKFARIPNNEVSLQTEEILSTLGLSLVIQTLDSADQGLNSQVAANIMLESVNKWPATPGHISRHTDISSFGAENFERVLNLIAQKGVRLVTMSECVEPKKMGKLKASKGTALRITFTVLLMGLSCLFLS